MKPKSKTIVTGPGGPGQHPQPGQPGYSAHRRSQIRVRDLENKIAKLNTDLEYQEAEAKTARQMMADAIERFGVLRAERDAARRSIDEANSAVALMKPDLLHLRNRLMFAEGFIAGCGENNMAEYVKALEARQISEHL